MIIDHTGFSVSDYEAAKVFYTQALEPLGIRMIMEPPGISAAGFGRDQPQFWLQAGGAHKPPVHTAFAAESREQVRAFYQAALAAGGTDNGPPGVRAMYHPNYYGAFVRDLDGNNVEAVCHAPEA